MVYQMLFPEYARDEKGNPIDTEEKTGVIRCRICQRLLTDTKSVKAGIGPVCIKKGL